MDNQENDAETEVLPTYQILLSLLSLLGRVEAAKSNKLTNTTQMLKQLSLLVVETGSCETRQVTK
jgi:hypothetical protein